MSFRLISRGEWAKTKEFLTRMVKDEPFRVLEKYGQIGVEALAAATPVDSGLTADSWSYKVLTHPRPGIEWYNTNPAGATGKPVAILIQYGHGTGTGGFVAGRDYINPAIQHVFDEIADAVWKVVIA